jgi:hypothetical protein
VARHCHPDGLREDPHHERPALRLPDHTYRGTVCKHITAVKRAEAELATYAAGWDADAQAQRLACPDCGTALRSDVCYIGGKGYSAFLVCGCCHYG